MGREEADLRGQGADPDRDQGTEGLSTHVLNGSLGGAWRTLRAHPEPLLVPTLVLSTTGVVAHVLLQYSVGLVVSPTDPRGLLVGLFALYAVGQLVVTGIYAAALGVVDLDGERGPFTGWISTTALLSALVTAVLLTLNTLFLLVPAVVLGFLVRYAPLFVIDAGLRTRQALVSSVRFVIADLGAELWFVARALVVLLAGLAALGVGLYVAVPVVLLAQAARYRARFPLSEDRGC